MHYWSVDLCFSDPEGQTAQTCPKRLRGRQARRRWGGGDRQWSAESVTNSGWSSAWHHCFVSEELARSQPTAERGVCAVPTTCVVFHEQDALIFLFTVLHVSLSLCVCVHQSPVTLRLCGFLSSRRWCHHRNYSKVLMPNTLQTVRHKHTSGPQPL